MRDNTESSPEIMETRFRSQRNQTTLNIELGITGRQSVASDGVSQTSVAGGGSSFVGDIINGDIPDGACFIAETSIGDINIRDAEIGKKTPAFNFKTGRKGKCKILNVMVHEVSELLKVVIGGTVFYVTKEHKFWDGKKCTPIGNFKIGERVNGKSITESQVITYDRLIKVYNLTTEYGNYYANGFLVSNRKNES